MRKLLASAFVVFLSVGAISAVEDVYGEKPNLTKTTDIADILARPHDYEGEVVQVEGRVTAVCQQMGCWLKVGTSEGGVLLAKSTGDRITIPTDSAGRTAIVEGTVVVEHEESAEHAGAEHGHECPTATVRIETRGIVLL